MANSSSGYINSHWVNECELEKHGLLSQSKQKINISASDTTSTHRQAQVDRGEGEMANGGLGLATYR